MRRKESTAKARRLAALRKRIAQVQGKAKFVGVLYLLATIGLLGLMACFPIIKLDDTNGDWLYALTFWKPFPLLMDRAAWTVEGIKVVGGAAIYALMLLVLFINVVKSFSKLGWLFKKKPSKQNGHNRNAYAMEDMGKIFSASFFVCVMFNFCIFLLLQANGAIPNVPNAIVVAGIALAVHFICGHIGGNVSLFVADGDVLTEEKRECGRISPIVRNVLQFAAICGIGYFIGLKNDISNGASSVLAFILEHQAFSLREFFPCAAQMVSLLFFAVLVGHATNITEFDSEGVEASGMKNFRVFTILLTLSALGLFAVQYLFFHVWVNEPLIIAGIALASFVIELIMKNMPNGKAEDPDEMDMDDYLEAYSQGGLASQNMGALQPMYAPQNAYAAQGGMMDTGAQFDPMSAYGLQPMYPQAPNYGFENYYDISEE